jgi:hypothetical protein
MDAAEVNRYADLIMTEIDKDIAAGTVAATVSSFGELHDHVDANDYSQWAGVPWGTDEPDEPYALVNRVEREVCRRLAERAGASECDACRHNRELLERTGS